MYSHHSIFALISKPRQLFFRYADEGKTFSKHKTISRFQLLSFFPAQYMFNMSSPALDVKLHGFVVWIYCLHSFNV